MPQAASKSAWPCAATDVHRPRPDTRPAAMKTLPDFAPAPSATRRDYVAQTLRDAILTGRIAPGTQLVESHFATQFGVSRGLLREAIRELIETGLLVNKPYAGTYVTDISEETMSDVY